MNHHLKMILEGYITGVLTRFSFFSGFFFFPECLYINFCVLVVSCLFSVVTCNHPTPTNFSLHFAWILFYICKMVLICYEVIIISQKVLSTESQLIVGLQWIVIECNFDNSNYLHVLVFLNLLCRNDAEQNAKHQCIRS